MINNFAMNEQESKVHRPLMRHFYEFIAPGREPKYYDGKTKFEIAVQRKLDVDLTIPSENGEEGYEEKIIKWPEKGEPHTSFYAETESCTNPGNITYGWMRTGQADYLIYVFEYPNGLDIHKIRFQVFKDWFWQEIKRGRPFPPSRNADNNRTQGLLVNIVEVHKKIPAERYFLTWDGVCRQIQLNTNARTFESMKEKERSVLPSYNLGLLGVDQKPSSSQDEGTA